MRSATEIQQDLDEAYASRRTALKAQGYSLDTGQGKQQVQRANLADINATIRELEAELAQVTADGGGILAGNFRRH